MAVRDDSGDWFLINASPDLPAQIRSCSDLHPATGTLRGTPLSGVFLTNADLDHVLGLWTLREGEKLHIHATRAVHGTLDESLNVTAIMETFCGIAWHEPPETDFAPVLRKNGERSSLLYRAIKLPGNPPLFARGKYPDGVHSVAYEVMDRNTGGRLPKQQFKPNSHQISSHITELSIISIRKLGAFIYYSIISETA